MGKDDIWNGIALCHLHHWAFDVGWFALLNDYNIQLSTKLKTYRQIMEEWENISLLTPFQ